MHTYYTVDYYHPDDFHLIKEDDVLHFRLQLSPRLFDLLDNQNGLCMISFFKLKELSDYLRFYQEFTNIIINTKVGLTRFTDSMLATSLFYYKLVTELELSEDSEQYSFQSHDFAHQLSKLLDSFLGANYGLDDKREMEFKFNVGGIETKFEGARHTGLIMKYLIQGIKHIKFNRYVDSNMNHVKKALIYNDNKTLNSLAHAPVNQEWFPSSELLTKFCLGLHSSKVKLIPSKSNRISSSDAYFYFKVAELFDIKGLERYRLTSDPNEDMRRRKAFAKLLQRAQQSSAEI